MYKLNNVEGTMEDIIHLEDDVQERSWIVAALANGTSFAMNLVLVAGLTYWMVG
ncbi:MAG: hypothetical protein HOJ68_07850 [Bacteroidetes bacterium]|nr:hypothetical protein [Bacteroidota bacterium]